MDFGSALNALKNGRFIARKGWNGRNMTLFIKEPLKSDVGAPTRSYIMMLTAQEDLVPWTASQSDILETDWEIVGPDEDMRLVASQYT